MNDSSAPIDPTTDGTAGEIMYRVWTPFMGGHGWRDFSAWEARIENEVLQLSDRNGLLLAAYGKGEWSKIERAPAKPLQEETVSRTPMKHNTPETPHE